MIKHLALACLAATAAPALAAPIDGTWKADLATAKLPARPDVNVLKDGTYDCQSCLPPYKVAADGAFHPIPGHAYVDMVAVKAIDPRTFEQRNQLKGKLVGVYRNSVSADGRTLTTSWEDMTAPSGEVARGSAVATRLGTAIAGAHPASGAWRTTKLENVSDQAVTVSYVTLGRSVSFKTPDGFAYTAELGGKPVTMTGNPASQTIAVKPAPNGLIEESYDNGRLVDVRTLTVAPGGRTMTVVDQDKKRNTSTTWTMHKVG